MALQAVNSPDVPLSGARKRREICRATPLKLAAEYLGKARTRFWLFGFNLNELTLGKRSSKRHRRWPECPGIAASPSNHDRCGTSSQQRRNPTGPAFPAAFPVPLLRRGRAGGLRRRIRHRNIGQFNLFRFPGISANRYKLHGLQRGQCALQPCAPVLRDAFKRQPGAGFLVGKRW